MRAVTRFITARRTSWIVLVAAAIAAVAVFALGRGDAGERAPGVGLPDSAESVRADRAAASLPGADGTTALLVYSRDGGDSALDDADLAEIGERAASLADLASDGFVPPPTIADDGSAALLVVPLEELDDVDAQAERAAELRAVASDDLPAGLDAVLTGPEGFAVDVAGVFAGADVTLLVVTVLVVAVLLLVTYRSPWLWLVPLSVVGTADALAAIVATRVAAAAGIVLDASVTGILSVLVFGAGTNYALLLIARYRDELRKLDDRRAAMERALRGAGPAIIASGTTVVLALATLAFAELEGNRALGIACAAGVVIAMLFATTVLPAALVLFGRGLFWPYVPRVGTESIVERGVWRRLGTTVSRRPGVVAVVGALVLGALALGGTQVRVGLSQTESFRDVPEAVVGQQLLADAFSAGTGSPVVVITAARDAESVAAAAAGLPSVEAATLGESDGDLARVDVVLDVAAETPEAEAAIERLRAEFAGLAADGDVGEVLVGGLDARALDVAAAQERDERLVIPLILALVLVVLVVLLRALLAPVLLLATVVASFFASLGAGWLVFEHVLGFPALDDDVVLFSFLFLVALGVDYNIFLTTRAREEAREHGTRAGMIRALAATGGVITSAGILLAAVFAVLGVLPLITLTQIGVIVCIGVLLDTLLVRTVIVPALAFLTGERFWWPGRAVSVGAEVRLSALAAARSTGTAGSAAAPSGAGRRGRAAD